MTVTPQTIAKLTALNLTPEQFATVVTIISEVSAARRKSTPPPPDAEEEDLFQHFYRAYPRRESPAKARQAWVRARIKADAQTLIRAAKRFAMQRVGEDPKYTPLPASWLNAEKWLDEPQPKLRNETGVRRSARSTISEQAIALIERRYEATEP